MKAIIYYYSLTGNTKLAAETLGKQSGADIREVQEAKQRNMFSAFVPGCLAALRRKASSIKPIDVNLKNIDTVFIGSPIWAGNCVPAINALMKQINLKNKNVILFFTMGGGGDKKAVEHLSRVVAGQGGKVTDSASFQTSGKNEELIQQVQEFGKKYKK